MAKPFASPRVIRRTDAHFPVRKIGNDYSDTRTKTAFDEEVVLTQLFVGISMFFPPGERFMIRAVRSVEDRLVDPQLRADVDAFVRQEAQHAAEHGKANTEFTSQIGLDADRTCREITALWDLIERRCTPRQRVAFTAAIEHFTAVLADIVLADLAMLDRVDDPKSKQLFIWHAIEECEHKSVAFDAYREIGGGELQRILTMAVFTPPALVTAALPFLRLVHAHGELTNLRSWRHARRVVLGRWGRHMARTYLAYYRPGFHPAHLFSRDVEVYWRDQLGADAMASEAS